MPSFVALVRGINVGGHALVGMEALRKFVESQGCSEVRSLLQSGNLIFESEISSEAALEERLEKHAPRHLGRPLDFLVREAGTWREILDLNPFAEEAARDPGHLLVMFLRVEPRIEALASLQARITGGEYFQSRGKQLYLFYPVGIGRSKFTGALIERTLGLRGTARNWNTVQKIAALLTAP